MPPNNPFTITPPIRPFQLRPRLIQPHDQCLPIPFQRQQSNAFLPPRRITSRDKPQKRFPLRLQRLRRKPLGAIRSGRSKEIGHEAQEEELRGEEDDLVRPSARKPLPRGQKIRFRMLHTAVGRRHVQRLRYPPVRQRQEIQVHLRGKALRDVGGRQPARERLQTFGVQLAPVRPHPVLEPDLLVVDCTSARIPLLIIQLQERGWLLLLLLYSTPPPPPPLPREQDPALLETLPDGADAVCRAVLVQPDVPPQRRQRPVRGVDVAPREDVGGGEGGGSLHAAQQEDLVRWGDQHDAFFTLVRFSWSFPALIVFFRGVGEGGIAQGGENW